MKRTKENGKKKKTLKKKESRRSRDPYRALKPELNLKTRYEEIADLKSYAHKLNDKDRAWLNKFSEEYINASFDENPRKNLHKTKELRKTCTDRNNARNRDQLTRAHAQRKNLVVDLTGLMKKELGYDEDED